MRGFVEVAALIFLSVVFVSEVIRDAIAKRPLHVEFVLRCESIFLPPPVSEKTRSSSARALADALAESRGVRDLFRKELASLVLSRAIDEVSCVPSIEEICIALRAAERLNREGHPKVFF